jgi:dipeptide/tripeptide permease
MTEPATQKSADTSALLPERPTLLAVVRRQRKVVVVALLLSGACFWVMGPMGRWVGAALTVAGIGLALLNHLVGELWLGRLISSGEAPTRARIAGSTIIRLGILAVVAVAVATVSWPDGVGLLLGLALFRLIALVMTGVPLLKELKAQ